MCTQLMCMCALPTRDDSFIDFALKNCLHCTFFISSMLVLGAMISANLFVYWPDGTGYHWTNYSIA